MQNLTDLLLGKLGTKLKLPTYVLHTFGSAYLGKYSMFVEG